MKHSLLTLVLALLVLSGCRHNVSESRPAPVNTPTPDLPPLTYVPHSSIPDFVNQLPFQTNGEKAGMIAAWKRLTDHEHFKTARPEKAEAPMHEYGEIAGAYGLALFVVDVNKTQTDRFGLVIMLERTGDRYDAYWIFRDRDFSDVWLSRSSGSLFVRKVRTEDDGWYCRIEYVRAKGKWTCE